MPLHDEPTLLFRDGTSRPVSEMLEPANLMEQRLLRWLKLACQFPGERGCVLLTRIIRHYGESAGAGERAEVKLALIAQTASHETRAFALALECALIESGMSSMPVPLWRSDDAVYVDEDGILRRVEGRPVNSAG